jgi:tetratricopeptide (TPR) repeat protein
VATKTMKRVSAADQRKAQELDARGLKLFQSWDIADAAAAFEAAAQLVPNNPDYRLNLARALARSGDYDRALKALAEFISVETDPKLVERYERVFGNAMDEVETLLTKKMTAAGMPLEEIGAAIQMWLEFRITLGRNPLSLRRPEVWAAGLDFTVQRLNLHTVTAKEVAERYGASEQSLREKHQALVETLDIMPCDYRYFTGKDNPLDKLVEAAELLEQLELKFRLP